MKTGVGPSKARLPSLLVTSVAPELLRHHEAMRRLATRLVVADDVDDVVQETMVRALEHPPRGDLGAWLGSVLRNVVRFRHRSDSRRRRRETVAAQRDATPAPRGATSDTDPRQPVDALQEMEAAEQVSQALRELREPYRAILVQRYFLRRSLADVARELGVREDTVRQRHKRGLDMMRIALAKKRNGGSPPLTRARLATVFAPWISSGALAPTTTTALSKASVLGAVATFFLSVTTMKSKVALGIAAVVALAGISAYALWDPDANSAPPPVGRPDPEVVTANLESSPENDDTQVETKRIELVESPGDPSKSATAGPGADIRVVWDDDDSPAVGMQVFLTDYSRWTSATQPDHIETTGDDGVAKFRGLDEGRYLLEGRFRPVKSSLEVVTVTATSHEEDPVEVRIRRGTTVTGRVVDPDGRGIAGADVLRAGWASQWTQDVAVTESDGTFEIVGLHGRISMGARAAGFVPSVMRGMNLNEKKSDTLEVVLQPAAAELTIKVIDSTGSPVAGARAAVGIFGRQNQPTRGPDGSDINVMPNHTRTDEQGIAYLGGLAPGIWSLQVTAKGLSGYADEIEVPTTVGSDPMQMEREIQLPESIVIEGHVRDGNGLPLKEVYVGFGHHGNLVHQSTSTKADGSYRLVGAPVGAVKMQAQRKGLNRRETIETLPGRSHRWDVEFAAERKVHGSVRWEDGSAVAQASLSVWSIGSERSWHTIDRVDDEGHFVLEMPEYVKSIRVQTRTVGFYQVVHEGPLPDGNLDLVLGPEHRASATLRGRIVDPEGKPIPGADLWHGLLGQGNSSPIEVDADGRFEEQVTPGTFRLRIEVAGFARTYEQVEVGIDEKKELGDITLEHPAAISVNVDGAPPGELTFWLTHKETKRRTRLKIVNGKGSIGGLAGGAYRLQVCGDQIASESHEVLLQAAPRGGTPTEVRLQARSATPLAITLSVAEGARAAALRVADIEILDAAGQLVVRHRAGISAKKVLYTKFALAPGRYTLRAREGELSGTLAIAVQAVSTDPYEVTLELRPGG